MNNMDDPDRDMLYAVRAGNLEKVQQLIDCYGLSYCQRWAGGYLLLCEATRLKKSEVAKLLLRNGSRVNYKGGTPSMTPLHFSVENNDIEVVKMLVDKGARIDFKTSDGRSPLIIAVTKKYSLIAQHLLNCGASPNTISAKSRCTPLNIATIDGDEKLVELLLSNHANVNVQDGYGRTPLHCAAEYGYPHIIECLLIHGANINCVLNHKWKKGFTPLHIAAEKGNEIIMKLLMTKGSTVNATTAEGSTPLHIAVKNNHQAAVMGILLEYGADINATTKDRSTPLHIAVTKNSKTSVRDILEHGADVNARNKDNSTPLHVALTYGCERSVADLLEYGADVNVTNKNKSTPLHIAVTNNYKTSIRDLLKHGADVNAKNENDSTPLHIAVTKKYATTIGDLLKYGADVNAKNKHNSTPLHVALTYGCERSVTDLLEYGADVNVTNKNKSTPLHIAVTKNSETSVRDILEHGADVNARNKDNSTPLHIAVTNNCETTVRDLMKHGADVNARNKDNSTPLHIAVTNNCETTVRDLLTHGADVNARNKNNLTPLLLAFETRSASSYKVIRVLLEHGADVNAKNMDKQTPLNLAVKNGNLLILRDILDHKPDSSDEYNRLALCSAIRLPGNDSLKIVEELLNYGLEINARDVGDSTLLYSAVEKGHVKIVKDLLEYGANANYSESGTYYKNSVLHIAVASNHALIVELLINSRADVNNRNKTGHTPIYYAIENGNLEITRQLFNNKAHLKDSFDFLRIAVEKKHKEILEFLLNYIDAEATDKDGTTALHLAASATDNEAILKLLLSKGVNVDAQQENGYTALHIASEKGHSNIVDILLQHGSDINSMTEKRETSLDLASIKAFGFIIETLQHHVIKMKAANLYLNERNMQLFKTSPRFTKFKNFQSTCETEIVNMKIEKISSNISFYDILTAEMNKLAMYSRHETVVQALTTTEYKTKFPLYANMIDLQFKRGVRRNDLMEQSDRFFHAISSSLPMLTLSCTEEISSYLSDNDLRNLINACRPTKTCNPKNRKNHRGFVWKMV